MKTLDDNDGLIVGDNDHDINELMDIVMMKMISRVMEIMIIKITVL